jgi:hypothetical protein
MNFTRININGIIADTKELFSSFAPYVEYVEYLCIFPQRYLLSNSELKSKTYTFSVTNESTREKIVLKDVEFDEETETIKIFKHDITDEFPLTTIVQNIVNLLNWKSEEQIIIVTNGTLSFSYGIEYYCVRDMAGNIVDVCIKNDQSDCYVSVRHSDLAEKEYDYFDLV